MVQYKRSIDNVSPHRLLYSKYYILELGRAKIMRRLIQYFPTHRADSCTGDATRHLDRAGGQSGKNDVASLELSLPAKNYTPVEAYLRTFVWRMIVVVEFRHEHRNDEPDAQPESICRQCQDDSLPRELHGEKKHPRSFTIITKFTRNQCQLEGGEIRGLIEVRIYK